MNYALIDPFIECRVDEWSQTTLSNMLSVQVSVIFPFPRIKVKSDRWERWYRLP